MEWSKIDPNWVAAILIGVGGYIWHRFFPPKTQDHIETQLSNIETALTNAETIANGLLKDVSPGTTTADLEKQFIAVAKIQLAHIGLNPDKLPLAVQSLLNALIQQLISNAKNTNPSLR